MTERYDIYKEGLVANRFHPKNFLRFKDWGFDEFNNSSENHTSDSDKKKLY